MTPRPPGASDTSGTPAASAPGAPAIHGRFEGGFGWMAHPDELIERSSTAFAEGGRVWLIDPLRAQGLDAALAPLGKVVGVVITYGLHDRDVAWLANYYGVPVYFPRHLRQITLEARVEYVEGRVPESPLQLVPSVGRGLLGWFRDTAVWWPERRALAIGETLVSVRAYLLPGERLAVHPLRRLSPPTELLTLQPERVYCGHGPSLTVGATEAVAHAVRTARSEFWASLRHSLSVALRRRR